MKTSTLTSILDYCYDRAIGTDGTGHSKVADLAAEYATPGRPLSEGIDALVRWQVAKCAAAGFVTGIGGLATLPIAIPADLFANYYIQIRMIATIAHMCGQDLRSDRVRSLVYICLCGNAAADILKDTGARVGARAAEVAIGKLTGRGAASLGKAVPLFGGFVCGAIDAATCKLVGSTAKSVFLSKKAETF